MLSISLDKRRDGFRLQVAFEAPTPGIVALFGRSGCGKSTTVDLIAGLLDPDAGHVRINGTTLLDTNTNLSVSAHRRRIGYVFQDSRLFPHRSVAGNLRYGLKRAKGVAQRIGFDDVVSLLGLGSLLARRPNRLSGGERQRVALGRALLSQPQLLLLDEPLASLDTARREEVLPYLEALRDRLSIPMIFVSHQFDEVLRLATHVVLLDAGKVAAQGSPSQISLEPALRAIVGPEAVGAVLDAVITSIDSEKRLAELRIAGGTLRISARDILDDGSARHGVGSGVRVQLLARDIILATQPPHALSVRNAIEGTVTDITDDDDDAALVRVDIGGDSVLSRITRAAVEALQLRRGSRVWVLIKAVSLRGHTFTSRSFVTASPAATLPAS
jgi:molybdate transport system ATP-binding protein